MADILESLGNNSQLGKVLCELFGQIATSALLKANDNDKNEIASSSVTEETSPVCKSVPVSQNDGVRSLQKSISDDEIGKPRTTNNAVVNSSLGRPRYQWHDQTDVQGPRRTTPDLKQLYSVYVGHLPNDITQGELEDLFSDIGEVADCFVFPPTDGHTYTYGFVRFRTLNEAKDAVKERHSKVIGNNQINVELSSSTTRKLQTNPDDEDKSPLLRKDYPRVPRQTLSDNDEKQVIGKIKASLRRLNSNNVSSFGNCNPEEVFENIKTILKMLINHPSALADPSADRGEEKLRIGLTDSQSKLQALVQDSFTEQQSWGNSPGEVANQEATMPQCRANSRLPSFALEAAKSPGANMNKPFNRGNELPCTSIPCAPLIEKNNSSPSEPINSYLINKVREFLDSSSGEDNVLPSRSKRSENNIPDSKYTLSSSSTDDEQPTRTTTDVKLRHHIKSPDLPSHLDTPDPLETSNHQPDRSEPSTHDAIVCSQIEKNDDFPAQHSSGNVTSRYTNGYRSVRLLDETNSSQYTPETPKTRHSPNDNAPTQPVSCVEPRTDTGLANSTSLSRDSSGDDRGMCHPLFESPNSLEVKRSALAEEQNFEGILLESRYPVTQRCSLSITGVSKTPEQVAQCSSTRVNTMSEYIPQYRSEDQRSMHAILASTSKTHEARSCSPNSSDLESTGVLAKETVFHGCKDDSAQIPVIWNNLDHLKSTTGTYSYFPSPPSNLNTTLPKQQELTLNNDATKVVGSSRNQTSALRCFNDIPCPIPIAGDMTPIQRPSQDMENIKSVDAKECVLTSSNGTILNQHPLISFSKNSELSEKVINVDGEEKHVLSEHNNDAEMTGLLKQQKNTLEDMKTQNAQECLLPSIKQTLPEQPCRSFNDNLQHSMKLGNVSVQKKPNLPKHHIEPKFSEQQEYSSKKLIETSLGNCWPAVKSAPNKCYNLSPQFNANLKLSNVKVQPGPLQGPLALHQKDQFPNICNQIAKGITQIDSPGHVSTKNIETRALSESNVSHSSTANKQSEGDFLTPDENTAIRSNGFAVSQNGKFDDFDPQAKNTDFSPSVQVLFDNFRTNNGRAVLETKARGSDTVLTTKNGSKSSKRRALAPSFSFSAPKKDHKERSKTETHCPKQTVETCISNFPTNKEKFKSEEKVDVMDNDSVIVSFLKNDSLNPTFDMSEFDFGLDDNDASRSPLVESPEPTKNLRSPSCPSDDAETLKLKAQMNVHVLKLEELQQILNKYPQRKRKRLPHLFNEHGLELETRIHDAEILLQKKEEMWKARSNERELAYEKEMFHSADDNQLLGQFAQEMRKEFVRNEIIVVQLKCKIMELKIEQSRGEEMT